MASDTDTNEMIYRKTPLILEGRISIDGYDPHRKILVDEETLEYLLTDHFGPWQLRAYDEALPGGRYRLTIERID